jgi:predicted GNAT family N-acyltransferase
MKRGVTIAMTSFAESERAIRTVRDVVFGQEQKVDRALDWDGRDAQCIQVIATDDGGNPVGAGRMEPSGKIGRMAVLARWRRRGVGRRMLEALVDAARANGMAEVHLHAQVHAVPFYERHGFRREGKAFVEAGIRHVTMRRSLTS